MPLQYKPVKNKRFFTADTHYSDVDWNDETTAIGKFKEQLEDWFSDPIRSLISESPHFGFTIVALTCVLIDTLSQYYYGKETSSRTAFKDFLKEWFPDFGDNFPTSISVAGSDPVKNYADAVYHAFRCGILHEAHVALYGVVTGDADAIEYLEKEDVTLYANGKICPTVVINPEKFFVKIEKVFQEYFQKLHDANPQWNELRSNLKRKFLTSYGIEIGNEPK